MQVDVLGLPGDVLGYLIALKHKYAQICIGGDKSGYGKGENPPRDLLIYYDIPGYPGIISLYIQVYTRIHEYILRYARIYQDICGYQVGRTSLSNQTV
jgi:hypothetical protein